MKDKWTMEIDQRELYNGKDLVIDSRANKYPRVLVREGDPPQI